MNLKKVTAIIRCEALEKVEKKLQDIGVRGVSITKVKGYGEYANTYTKDWLVTHAKIEIFTETSEADAIAAAIIETAHTGVSGDGMVAIQSVDKLLRIRTKGDASADEI